MISKERLEVITRNDDEHSKLLVEMARELLAWRKAADDDEVLVALKRIEGYEEVDDQILAEDAMLNPVPWPEWRVVRKPALPE